MIALKRTYECVLMCVGEWFWKGSADPVKQTLWSRPTLPHPEQSVSAQDAKQRVRAVPALIKMWCYQVSDVREADHAYNERREKVFDHRWVLVLMNHPSVDAGFLNRMRHPTRCTHCPCTFLKQFFLGLSEKTVEAKIFKGQVYDIWPDWHFV